MSAPTRTLAKGRRRARRPASSCARRFTTSARASTGALDEAGDRDRPVQGPAGRREAAPAEEGPASRKTRESAERAYRKGRGGSKKKRSGKRSPRHEAKARARAARCGLEPSALEAGSLRRTSPERRQPLRGREEGCAHQGPGRSGRPRRRRRPRTRARRKSPTTPTRTCRCASKTTPSSATARRRRWSAGTGRSTGSACRGSTRRPASPRSSARRSTAAGGSRRRPRCAQVRRRYRPGTLVLETEFETDGRRGRGDRLHAAARPRPRRWSAWSRAGAGAVPMRMELVDPVRLRLDRPWVRRRRRRHPGHRGTRRGLRSGPAVELRGRGPHDRGRVHGRRGRARALRAGLASVARARAAARSTPMRAIEETETWWRDWSEPVPLRGRVGEPVLRSLITLKALTYAPTGGLVAAADDLAARAARRRAELGLPLLLAPRCDVHALRAHDRRLHRGGRAPGGSGCSAPWPDDPDHAQILYGARRRAAAARGELPWLPGYEGSRAGPDRQRGEHPVPARRLRRGRGRDPLAPAGRPRPDDNAWRVVRAWSSSSSRSGRSPTRGSGRSAGRGGRSRTPGSWRGLRSTARSRRSSGSASRARWSGGASLRTAIHDDVCRKGYDPELGAFVQSYGSKLLDASLLMMPLVGFLPAKRPAGAGHGRGHPAAPHDRRPRGPLSDASPTSTGCRRARGPFSPARSGWPTTCALQGRTTRRAEIFERLLSLRNDVGLLSEEYDPISGRLLGNFPQAFTHVGLINTAWNLARNGGPAVHRQQG